MIIAVAMTELGDIAVDQPDLIPFHLGIAFRDRAFPEAQRFYFRARQHDASFVHIVDGIVVACAPVLSDGFHLVERGVTRASRSEQRRVGKEWVSTGRSRWSPYN